MQNRNSKVDGSTSASLEQNGVLCAVPTVCLAWATKKRHIAVNSEVLCEVSSRNAGYSVKNGGYNTLALFGLPTYNKHTDDMPGTHGDGFIEYKPLSQQRLVINTKTICKKCVKQYEKLMAAHYGA
jgi:hypothetical protein